MSRADLSALVVRAQTGDHQAYAQLVRRFQDMAVGYAYALLGDFHLAEDAAQEAFVGALFAASAGNHLEMARLLLECGADPNAHSDSSGCCLTIAAHRHPDACGPMQELLRRHGAYLPPYALDNAELSRAITENGPVLRHEQFLHELMERDDPGLWRLAMNHRPELIASLYLTDIWSGRHPTDPGVVRALVAAGLDVNRPNWIGRTFLHRAAEKGDLQAAGLYLELGADLDALELEYGGTPLAAAAREGQREMARFLLDRGADATAPADASWAQPLARAEGAGHGEIAALLREHLEAQRQGKQFNPA